jgi:hypothetical protein
MVIGIAGDEIRPWLVLGLRHADGQLHRLELARPSKGMLSPQFAPVLAEAGPEESPIRSRWQHAAVPTWRRVPPTAVCEVAYTVLDLSVGSAEQIESNCERRVSRTDVGSALSKASGKPGPRRYSEPGCQKHRMTATRSERCSTLGTRQLSGTSHVSGPITYLSGWSASTRVELLDY